MSQVSLGRPLYAEPISFRTSISGSVNPALRQQQFPRVMWHVCMPFVAMALPWCRTADMQSGGCCYLYPRCTVSPLSDSSLSLQSFLSFNLMYNPFASYSLIVQNFLFSPSPFLTYNAPTPPFPPPGSPIQADGACEHGRTGVHSEGVWAAPCGRI